MKLKKIAAAMLAAAMVFGSFAAQGVCAADNASVADDVDRGLYAPQNLRYEDGDIKWDKVADAYGYILRVSDGENEWEREHNFTNEEDLFVEFDRFCYENSIPLGTYTVRMCTFDVSGECSEWTKSVTANYAATLSSPGNVRLSEDEEETVLWDEVDGAYRYNIRITNENGFNWSHYTSSTSWGYYWYCDETGAYSFSVQAIDKDYNVSEWRSLNITHTQIERVHLDAPKNVRFDESGENILWDAVDGADRYTVEIDICATDENENSIYEYSYAYPTEPRLDNWKSIAALFPNARYQIYVYAHKDDVDYENETSEALEATYAIELDKSIEMPETLEADGNCLKWSSVDNADTYWAYILVNGKLVNYDRDSRVAIKAENYSEESGCYMGVLNYLPAEDYDVELYVVDKDGGYNKKTYSMTLGQSPNESVWVPKVYTKNYIIWDYDQFRHDDTQGFWVRVKGTKDDTVVKLEREWYGHYYGCLDLPNGKYTVEVCAFEYVQIDDEYNYGYRVGAWSVPLEITNHNGNLYNKENEITEGIELPPEAADIPDDDKITSITINPAFNMKNKHDNDVELDLSKFTIKAEAIYDEAGLKRAEEALGQTIKGNKHYNLLDLTLLYNGEDFSNGYEGLVQVIIPIPNGHRDKNISCFRLTDVDGKLVKEVIPGEQTEDSYIIYLEHFSLYALVADANPDDGEEEPENPEESSSENSAPENSGEPDSDTTTSSPENPDLESSGESNSDTTTTSPENSDLEGAGESNSNTTTTSPENSDLESAGDSNPPTGIALAAAPVILACAAVIAASKKKK